MKRLLLCGAKRWEPTCYQYIHYRPWGMDQQVGYAHETNSDGSYNLLGWNFYDAFKANLRQSPVVTFKSKPNTVNDDIVGANNPKFVMDDLMNTTGWALSVEPSCATTVPETGGFAVNWHTKNTPSGAGPFTWNIFDYKATKDGPTIIAVSQTIEGENEIFTLSVGSGDDLESDTIIWPHRPLDYGTTVTVNITADRVILSRGGEATALNIYRFGDEKIPKTRGFIRMFQYDEDPGANPVSTRMYSLEVTTFT